MSRKITHYRITYDTNDGYSDTKDIYCYSNSVCDIERYVYDNGEDVDLYYRSEWFFYVLGYLLIGKPTENKNNFWEEVKDEDIPKEVLKEFGYEV